MSRILDKVEAVFVFWFQESQSQPSALFEYSKSVLRILIPLAILGNFFNSMIQTQMIGQPPYITSGIQQIWLRFVPLGAAELKPYIRTAYQRNLPFGIVAAHYDIYLFAARGGLQDDLWKIYAVSLACPSNNVTQHIAVRHADARCLLKQKTILLHAAYRVKIAKPDISAGQYPTVKSAKIAHMK